METSTTESDKVIYNDYILKPVFDYSNGKRDWQVYRIDADYGRIVSYKTLQEVKEYVDEL